MRGNDCLAVTERHRDEHEAREDHEGRVPCDSSRSSRALFFVMSSVTVTSVASTQSAPTMNHIRYSAAACQTDLPNPTDRGTMVANTDRMLSMIDSAVAGSAPFLPVRLVVFPEFAHAAPVYATVAELLERLAVPIPNEHTDRLARKAREHQIYIQSGSMIEVDARWPGVVFNTTCLIGPEGHALQVPEGQPVDPLRSALQSARSRGIRRAAVSGRGHADRPDRLRDLLRLAVPGSHPAARREWRRGARARVGVHGPVGRDRADELVDARQSVPRAREHRPTSSRRTRAPACGTTLRTPGRAGARSWISTAACLRRRHRVQANGSWWHRSTSPRCVTSARRGEAITCSRT